MNLRTFFILNFFFYCCLAIFLVTFTPVVTNLSDMYRQDVQNKQLKVQLNYLDKTLEEMEALYGKYLYHVPEYDVYEESGYYSLRKKRTRDRAYAKKLIISSFKSRIKKPWVANIPEIKFIPMADTTIRTSILKMYPQGWIETEISSIIQVDTNFYNPAANIDMALASCIDNELTNQVDLVFFDTTFSTWSDIECLQRILPHEVGHANDWSRDNNLLFTERIYFLKRVSDRLVAPDRYLSDYVESIADDEDVYFERWLKAAEYWAEICAEYFQGHLDNLDEKDIEIIEWVIEKDDPTYDVFKGLSYRIFGTYRGYGKRSDYSNPPWTILPLQWPKGYWIERYR